MMFSLRLSIVLACLLAAALAAAPARATVPRGFIGMVSEDTLAGDASYRADQLSDMQDLGVTLLRQTFDWGRIEQRPGRFDFSYLDSFVGDAARHGIRVMPVLFGEPPFYSRRPAGNKAHGTYAPRGPASFARFARAAVKRYGPRGSYWDSHPTVLRRPIRVWQIWNEPNLKVYWLPRPSAASYVNLLKATARSIRKLDPGAEVVTAGIPQSEHGVGLRTYVGAMLRAGAGPYFDSLAVNAYATTGAGVVNFLRGMRRYLDVHGAPMTSLRATEMGWSDAGPPSAFASTPQGQAARIKSAILGMAKARVALKLLGFVYYNWRDSPPYNGGKDFWGLHTGLQTQAGVNKPAFAAFAHAVEGL